MKQAKTLKSEELKLVLAYVAVRRHAARNRTIILASFLSGMHEKHVEARVCATAKMQQEGDFFRTHAGLKNCA